MTITEILLISLVVSIGAALQGSVGFGMALAANPILVLINPEFVPGPMLASAFFLSILVIIRERQSLSLNGLQWAIAGRLLGAILSAWLLLLISPDALILLFGFLVIFAVLITAFGFKIPITKINLGIAGTLAGIMGTIGSIGGPPMALVYQREDACRIRTTLSGFFIAGTAISMATLAMIGRFGVQEIKLTGLLIPGLFFGFILSSKALPWFDGKYTRPIILLISTISALVVITRQLL